jgi:sulfate transport system substrate-binding protein
LKSAVFDTGGRAATVTFAERQLGDVLLSFESEVRSIAQEYGDDQYEVLAPPVSVLAEFPVAVVDKVVDARGTREVATAYLQLLYSEPAQELVATRAYRVRSPAVTERNPAGLAEVELLDIVESLGPWGTIQRGQHRQLRTATLAGPAA